MRCRMARSRGGPTPPAIWSAPAAGICALGLLRFFAAVITRKMIGHTL